MKVLKVSILILGLATFVPIANSSEEVSFQQTCDYLKDKLNVSKFIVSGSRITLASLRGNVVVTFDAHDITNVFSDPNTSDAIFISCKLNVRCIDSVDRDEHETHEYAGYTWGCREGSDAENVSRAMVHLMELMRERNPREADPFAK